MVGVMVVMVMVVVVYKCGKVCTVHRDLTGDEVGEILTHYTVQSVVRP